MGGIGPVSRVVRLSVIPERLRVALLRKRAVMPRDVFYLWGVVAGQLGYVPLCLGSRSTGRKHW